MLLELIDKPEQRALSDEGQVVNADGTTTATTNQGAPEPEGVCVVAKVARFAVLGSFDERQAAGFKKQIAGHGPWTTCN